MTRKYACHDDYLEWVQRISLQEERVRLISFLDNMRHHVNLGNACRHEHGELRMLWPGESVVNVLRRPTQPPDTPWIRTIQRTELDKPVRT